MGAGAGAITGAGATSRAGSVAWTIGQTVCHQASDDGFDNMAFLLFVGILIEECINAGCGECCRRNTPALGSSQSAWLMTTAPGLGGTGQQSSGGCLLPLLAAVATGARTAIGFKAATTTASSSASASALSGDGCHCAAETDIVEDVFDFGLASVATGLVVVVGLIIVVAVAAVSSARTTVASSGIGVIVVIVVVVPAVI